MLHADMDAFYASIEQRDRPELAGRPVVVGGTSARGVVCAASYEARRFGVRSAMPTFRARRLCPGAVFLPPDMPRYAEVSREVHRVLAEVTPEVEPLALDEAFLDVTASVGLFGGPLETGRWLKRAIRERLGLAVSVGLAPNKLVAKLACSFGKPDGLLLVPSDLVQQFLAPLPVRRLWTVGPELEALLHGAGIRTVGELAALPAARARELLGRRAEVLRRLALGQDDRPVASRPRRSIGEERTLDVDLNDSPRALALLLEQTDEVARRLRAAGLVARTVTVKVKLARARSSRPSRVAGGGGQPVRPLLTRSATLSAATDDDARLRAAVAGLWARADVTEPVRLLGVTASGLAAAVQLGLFEAIPRAESSASRRLGPALDALRERFGPGVVRRGSWSG